MLYERNLKAILPSRSRHFPAASLTRIAVGEAIEMAKDVITGYAHSLIEDCEPVPVKEDLIECRLTAEAHA